MGTEFFYRAYVTYKDVTYYGEIKSFTTVGVEVRTGDIDPDNFTVTSSAGMGNDVKSVRFGICYGPTKNVTIDNNTIGLNEAGEDGSYTLTITPIPYGTVYYRAFLMIGSSAYYGETKSFRRDMKVGIPIDLGLSVKWASMNVGADVPSDAGCYFAWGETVELEGSSWSSYRYASGDMYSLTKYNTKSTYGTVDGKTVLENIDDAAYSWWGSDWRMPTVDEFRELYNNCDWVWTTQDGMNGYLVKSKVNENSIFLPAAGFYGRNGIIHINELGYYWSSDSYNNNTTSAYMCVFYSMTCVPDDYTSRIQCLPVRPVSDK